MSTEKFTPEPEELPPLSELLTVNDISEKTVTDAVASFKTQVRDRGLQLLLDANDIEATVDETVA